MKYLSLFSGIGGFELGIQKAYEDNQNRQQKSIGEGNVGRDIQRQGDIPNNRSRGGKNGLEEEKGCGMEQWLCIGYSEIDKYAIQVYQRHFNHTNYGDITRINEKELPDFDLLCGGFPCQSFSIAGKRGGFEDTRGTLFFDIARIVREKQPRLLLLENVKGLLSHDKGRTFATIISTLDELGYDLQWQVLNSKNFGVPQNRERVFIIGHLRGTSRPEVFPFGEGNSERSGKDAQGDDIAYCLQAGGDKHRGSYIQQLNQPKHSNDRVYGTDGVSPTLNTMQGGRRQPFVADYRYDEGLRKRKDFISPTIRQEMKGQDISKSVLLVKDFKIRRLTPKECERLQGFEDHWTKYGINEKGEQVEISDTQRYKTLGNAVTVNVIEAIISKMV